MVWGLVQAWGCEITLEESALISKEFTHRRTDERSMGYLHALYPPGDNGVKKIEGKLHVLFVTALLDFTLTSLPNPDRLSGA
jgi:hypothetical protein